MEKIYPGVVGIELWRFHAVCIYLSQNPEEQSKNLQWEDPTVLDDHQPIAAAFGDAQSLVLYSITAYAETHHVSESHVS